MKAADKDAATIMTIETALAKAQLSRVAMRDPHVTYNKFAVATFSKMTPALNWAELFTDDESYRAGYPVSWPARIF